MSTELGVGTELSMLTPPQLVCDLRDLLPPQASSVKWGRFLIGKTSSESLGGTERWPQGDALPRGRGHLCLAPTPPASHACRASHLRQRLHVDDVDEAEEEGHLCGHLGYVGKQAALGKDLGHWGRRGRGVSSRLGSGFVAQARAAT